MRGHRIIKTAWWENNSRIFVVQQRLLKGKNVACSFLFYFSFKRSGSHDPSLLAARPPVTERYLPVSCLAFLVWFLTNFTAKTLGTSLLFLAIVVVWCFAKSFLEQGVAKCVCGDIYPFLFCFLSVYFHSVIEIIQSICSVDAIKTSRILFLIQNYVAFSVKRKCRCRGRSWVILIFLKFHFKAS